MKIKAVIFDVGGVLIAEYEGKTLASFRLTKLLLKAGGERLRRDSFQGKISESKMWSELQTRLSLTDDYMKHFLQHLLYDRRPDEKIYKLAKNLRKKYKLAICSDGIKTVFDYWNRKFGFSKVFPVITLSARAHMSKPYKKIFKSTLKKLGVKPSEALFIDDLPVNIKGARAAGIAAFRYTGNNYRELTRWLKKNGVKVGEG